MVRENRGSIPGRVIPKNSKMVLDASLLNTQHYEVWIKGKLVAIQGKEKRPLLLHGVVAIGKREPSGYPRLRSLSILLLLITIRIRQPVLRNQLIYFFFLFA